jgi:hypothetical protein
LEECAAVYKNNPHTIKELQQEISAAVISVSEEILVAVLRNFRRRLQMVLDTDGAHTEMFLRDCQSPRLLNSETPNTVLFAM